MGTTKNVETTPRTLALAILAEAREGVRRADRAMAHCIRSAQRHGIGQDDILAATGLTGGQVLECLDRWVGDQS